MRLIIAGGRDFYDYDLLRSKVDFLLSNTNKENVVVVSGTAKGADVLGEAYARSNGMDIKRYPADWDKFGKKAGAIRNKQMAEYATHLIAFWDGKSKGTKNMIDIATEMNLKIRIVRYERKTNICTDYYPLSLPYYLRSRNDCTVCAFVNCFDTDYDKARDYLIKFGLTNRNGMARRDLTKALDSLTRYKATKLDIKKTQCAKFLREYPEGNYYAIYRDHAVAVIDGVLYDYEDSSRRFIKHVWKIEEISK